MRNEVEEGQIGMRRASPYVILLINCTAYRQISAAISWLKLRQRGAMEPENVSVLQQSKVFDRLEKRLREDFPQLQDDICVDLMNDVCATHGESIEGTCCLGKRRRIMEDAAPLADAWESADKLNKMFKRGAVPRHFQKVIDSLEK